MAQSRLAVVRRSRSCGLVDSWWVVVGSCGVVQALLLPCAMSGFGYGIAVVAFAASASACSTSSNPSGPSAGPFADRISGLWTLVAQQPAGEPESPPPTGATFAFQIVDGRTSVTADCNRCSGAAAVGDGTLTLGPALACTRAYCTTSAPFDNVFVRLLAAESVANIDGNVLTLHSERGTLRFRR